MINKEEFVRRFGRKGYTIKDGNVIYDDFINTICECLMDGEGVMLRGLGHFEIRRLKGIIRPKDIGNMSKDISPRRFVGFKMSANFKKMFRDKYPAERYGDEE